MKLNIYKTTWMLEHLRVSMAGQPSTNGIMARKEKQPKIARQLLLMKG